MSTSSRNIHTVFATEDDLGAALAAEIAEQIEQSFARNERFILGCPGGRTPKSTYRALATEFRNRELDLSELIIAMMDDYLVRTDAGWAPVSSAAHNSCRRFAHEEIQAVFNAAVAPERQIPDEYVWLPDPADPAAYERQLADNGGIDFFILASGAGDGHVAFNPPGSARDSTTRIVQLAEQTRRDNLDTFPDFESIDAVPTHGVTVGIATIADQSKRGVMIAIGSHKQKAVRRLLDGTEYDPSWPATVFRCVPGGRLYTDAAAAGEPLRDPRQRSSGD